MTESYSRIEVVDLDDTTTSFPDVFKDMTVSKFKRVVGIRKRSPPNSWEYMRLFFDGEEMENDRTLESYNLETGSRLHFVASTAAIQSRRPGPITPQSTAASNAGLETNNPQGRAPAHVPVFKTLFVMDFDGRTLAVNDVPHTERVEGLRQRIATKKGMDNPEYIRVIYKGKEFTDGKNLMDYDVQNDCTLHIVLRLPGGH